MIPQDDPRAKSDVNMEEPEEQPKEWDLDIKVILDFNYQFYGTLEQAKEMAFKKCMSEPGDFDNVEVNITPRF